MVNRDRLLDAAQFLLKLAKERGNEAQRLLPFKDAENKADVENLCAEARKLVDGYDVIIEVIAMQDAIEETFKEPS